MRARVHGIVAIAAFTLGACRAVIGIEDLTLDASARPASTGNSPRSDAGGASNSGGSADDGGGKIVTKEWQTCWGGPAGNECLKCCKELANSRPQTRALEDVARAKGCLCGPFTGSCQADCRTTMCATPPGAPADPRTDPCPGCVDQRLKSGAPPCEATFDECDAPDSGCTYVGRCIRGCPSP